MRVTSLSDRSPASQSVSGSTVKRKSSRWSSPLYRQEIFTALIALTPALLLFMIFLYYPLVMTLRYSFTDWNGFSRTFNNVGFDNFLKVFSERSTLNAFGNTIYLAFFMQVVGMLIQFPLAVLLAGKMRGRGIVKAVLYIPALLSPLIVGVIWSSFLQYTGIVNEVLKVTGLGFLVSDWLGDPDLVKNTLVAINTWQYSGLGMVIIIAAINGIPEEIVEAATLEGARGFTKFRRITLPLIMPAVTISLFLGITGSLKIFELPFILTRGGPREASTTMIYSIYDNAFQYQRAGLSSAMGLVFFIFIAAVTIIQLWLTRKKEVEF